MENNYRYRLAITTAVFLCLISACGGGGESSPNPLPPKILSWSPPTSYSDGSPLNPANELDSFEVYVKEGSVFSDADVPAAYVSAVNRSTGQVTTSFDLANLGPFLNVGIQYHVTLRAVAVTGAKSGFSQPADFSF